MGEAKTAIGRKTIDSRDADNGAAAREIVFRQLAKYLFFRSDQKMAALPREHITSLAARRRLEAAGRNVMSRVVLQTRIVGRDTLCVSMSLRFVLTLARPLEGPS